MASTRSSAICCGMTDRCQPRPISAGSPQRDALPPPSIDPEATLLFVINAAAGAFDLEAKRTVIQSALAAHGRKGELLSCQPADLAQVAGEAAKMAVARDTAVIAVGGDGSLNTVAQAAHAAGCAMGVIPYGTFNYFARSHGIATDPGEAVRQLLATQPRPVIVPKLNDRIFLVNASLGLYPQLLEDREYYKARFGRSRWVAIGAGIATLLRAQQRLRLHIELGDGARDVRTMTIFVGHNRLQLAQWGVRPEDAEGPHLTAVMLRPIGTWRLLDLLRHGAMGTLGDAQSIERFEFDHMVVRPSRLYRAKRVKVAFDGEVTWMHPPLDFRVLDQPLWLLEPAQAAA